MERILKTIGLAVLLGATSLAFADDGHDHDHAPDARQDAATPHHELHAHDDSVAAFFDGPFITHSTSNFRIHSNHPDWAHEAGSLLEFTHERFYDIWGDLAAPLDEPLTWVGFNHRDEFHRYAHESDGVDMSWSDGYYSARTNRVVVVHPTSREPQSVTRGRDSQDVLGQDGEDRPADTEDESGTEKSEKQEPRPAMIDTGQVTHEAAHQIAFNSGLQRRGVMYPLWVSEGLATNFETNDEGEFGPDVDNPNRRRQLLRAWEGGRMMPLEDLIVMTRVPRSPGQSISEVYAQCWAFFQFLYAQREGQLKHYLATLRQNSPGHRRNRTLRNEFYDSFGDIRVIEAAFHDFIRDEMARR